MNPRIKDVKPNSDYTLTLTFNNNEIKIFDKLIKNINFKILKLYSRKDWIPVIMYIHGSIKMRCFRKDCGHWNVLNFLPNINDDFLQSVQD